MLIDYQVLIKAQTKVYATINFALVLNNDIIFTPKFTCLRQMS